MTAMTVAEKHRAITEAFNGVNVRQKDNQCTAWISGLTLPGNRQTPFEASGATSDQAISALFDALAKPGQVIHYSRPYVGPFNYVWDDNRQKFVSTGPRW